MDELQSDLAEKRGMDASLSTIWRALERGGYSLKTVSLLHPALPESGC
jgi:hypothetical protein